MKKCFAKKDDGTCNALTECCCGKCKFYKPKSEIKNNIFYPYSFTSKRLYQDVITIYERKFNVKFKGWAMLQELREELILLESELDLLENKKSEIEQDISFKQTNLKTLKSKIEELHKRLDKINSRDKAIYIEKVLLGWSNNKISAKHYALTRQQISRIVNNVEKKIRMWPNVTSFFLYLKWGGKNGKTIWD